MNKTKNIYALVFLIILFAIIPVLIYYFPGDREDRETYKIGFVTDIHAFRNKKNNYDIVPKSRAPFLFFIDHMNNEFKPDFVVQGGDFIEGRFREGQKSIDDFLLMKRYYDNLIMPHYHVIGNHETSGFSREEWSRLTDNENTYYYFDYDQLRVIVLDGNDIPEISPEILAPGCNHYYISDHQLNWLEEALSDADERGYKKIVFVHQFLLHNHELGIKSKGGEKIIFPDHAKKIRDMLEKYKVNAVISGHIERLFCEKIDSVNYFSSPGFFKSKENGIL
ncbi:MAG: metallophosphoesterase [Candidatus Moranbacteria bacterium]|nr:metallophosphoesterase [Candidatus Moranbacteria bacterium]